MKLLFVLVIAPIGYSEVSALEETQRTGLLVPLYKSPGAEWNRLIQTKTTNPDIPILAVINPDNKSKFEPPYLSGINDLKTSGITVLGYVWTNYTQREADLVKNEINSYHSLYSVDGIFFDEMSNREGNQAYYENLDKYTKSLGLTFTVGNAGVDVLPSYVGIVDLIVIHDNIGFPQVEILGGWHTDFDKNNFAVLSFGVDNLDTEKIASISNYVGYMFITNDNVPNPWDSLPPYLDDLVSLSQKIRFTVEAKNINGTHIPNILTEVYSNGNLVKSGFSPFTYSLANNLTYTVCVTDYQNLVFDHWQDGDKNRCKSFLGTADTELVAYYKALFSITVETFDRDCREFSGIWTEVYSNGNLVKSGFSPLSFETAEQNSEYVVVMDEYKKYRFDHWENGEEDRYRTIVPLHDVTLAAFYKVRHH